jgi:hypothetical protein
MNDTPDWIVKMQSEHDWTPEWVQGRSLIEALGNIAYDIGQLAARLTMLQQRVSELMILMQQEQKHGTIDAE